MKTDIKNIELIHKYLDKSLNHDEIETIENQLQTDLEFQDLYKEQLILIQGVKRAGLKQEIQTAKKSYYKFRWLKISGISLSFIVVLLLVWMTFFKASQIKTSKPITESNTVVISNTDLVEEIEQGEIKILKDSAVVGVDIIKISSKEKTLITSQELKDQTERVKVKESEFVRFPLDSISIKKKPQAVIDKTEKVFSETIKDSATLNIPEIAFINSLIGTYEMKLEASNALIIDKLTLNQNGTFEFHEYDRHDNGIPPERNKYAKGTWVSDKNIIYFTAINSDIDSTHQLNFNATKARFISKSPRDKSDRVIETSLLFYESELFWITGRTLLKK
ncbi:hypothetical protein [Psychroserpens ponticola]|uniref:FecR protein domain-containing protein n=1 Tax=Psychroserpens ponticola TaxID=2932268 RepID=A0ABY7RWN3_9FLAO|nr:hypothetical protein [Psychroserpens ponticola]WCO01556.1 hypothetical protein MUN68_016005 [Psychroserpens ponticola]